MPGGRFPCSSKPGSIQVRSSLAPGVWRILAFNGILLEYAPQLGAIPVADNPYRQLPAINEVLETPPVQALASHHSHELIVAAVRQELTDLRQRLGRGEQVDGQANLEFV